MIGIKLNESQEFLKTEEGTTISLKLENPVFFSPDKLSPGSFSWPFNIPLNPNKALLGNPHVVENIESLVPIDASIYSNNHFLKSGKIHLKEVKDKISTYFTFGLNSASDSFKTKKLRDVTSDLFVPNNLVVLNNIPCVKKIHTDAAQINIVVNGIDHTQSGWYFSYPSGGIGAPPVTKYPPGPVFENVPFIVQTDENSPDNRIIGTHWIVKMVTFQMVPDILGFETLTPIDCTDPNVEMNVEIVGQAVGTYVLQPEIAGYYTGFETFLEPYFNGSLPLISPQKYIRFPFIASNQLVENKSTPYINQNDGSGNVIRNTPEASYEFDIAQPSNINSLQAFATLRYALDRCAIVFGFTYEGDFWDSGLADQLLIWNTAALDLPQKYVNGEEFLFWRRNFSMAELLPDISVVDFFKHLQQSFNLAIYYNELTKKVRLQYRETIANDAGYVDVTSKASPVDAIVPVSFAENDKVIESLTSTPLSFSVSDSFVETILNFNHKKDDSFNMMLFKYEGVKTVGTYTYPYVSLYQFPTSPIWDFMQKRMRSVTVKMKLSLADILQLNWELKRRFDRVDYLIKTIDFKLSETGIEVSEVEIYTMR